MNTTNSRLRDYKSNIPPEVSQACDIDLVLHYSGAAMASRKSLKSVYDCVEIFRPVLLKHLNGSFEDREGIFALLINRNSKPITTIMLGIGNEVSTLMDTKKLLTSAVLMKASSVVLCHNHPSGNPNPSPSDDALTKLTKANLSLFGCVLLDHIIITKTDFYSYKSEGKLDEEEEG